MRYRCPALTVPVTKRKRHLLETAHYDVLHTSVATSDSHDSTMPVHIFAPTADSYNHQDHGHLAMTYHAFASFTGYVHVPVGCCLVSSSAGSLEKEQSLISGGQLVQCHMLTSV